MPLIMSPCAQDEASTLAHTHHLATSIHSLSSSTPSKHHHYLKVTNTSTNEITAYAIWISLTPPPPRPPPRRCYYHYNINEPPNVHDHDPWRLSLSQLATTAYTNDDNSGLYIGMKERLWSGCLYRAARAASQIRRFGFGLRAGQCGRVAIGGGCCCVGGFVGVSKVKRA